MKFFRPSSTLLASSLAATLLLLSPAQAAIPSPGGLLETLTYVLLGAPKTHIQFRQFPIRPERREVPVLGAMSDFGYAYFPQKDPAPLVVMIAGLGGHYSGGGMLYLGEVLHESGFEVMTVSSPLNWSFELGASQTGASGFVPRDAKDLYAAIQKSIQHVRDTDHKSWPAIHLIGFSLGGPDAAFVSKIDSEERRIGFDRTVLINPPVDLVYDTPLLDSFYDAGADWSKEERDEIETEAFGIGYGFLQKRDLSPTAFHGVMQQVRLPEKALRYLIGESFRSSLAEALEVSQLIHDRGVLKTPVSRRRRDARHAEALRYTFREYAEKVLIPDLAETGEGEFTFESLGRASSLPAIEDFLAGSERVRVLHNENDFLLRPQDVEFLKRTFGKRLYLFPNGGHGGNFWDPRFQMGLVGALR